MVKKKPMVAKYTGIHCYMEKLQLINDVFLSMSSCHTFLVSESTIVSLT